MRVTLVSPFDPRPASAETSRSKAQWGGVEQVFSQTSKHLARRGHHVSVVCSTDGPSGQTYEDDVEWIQVKRSGTLWRTPLVDLASRVPEDSDVVQVAATYPFTTGPVLRRARALGVPCVLDFHFEPAPPGVLGQMAARVHRVGVPSRYRLAAAVLLRSREYGRSAPSLRKIPEDRWRILPNGVDTTRFSPRGAGSASNKAGSAGNHLLFVGRLVPYKGLEVLLKALARHPVPYPLVVVGDGPLRGHLQTMARRLGVDARFLGRVDEETLCRLYRDARLTVLPSVNRQEAFGITLLESMACGTPVVASGLPGVRHVAMEGGRIVEPGDPEVLGQAIRRSVASDDLPRGQELAQQIHERYSWQAVTDRLLRVYRDVLQQHRFGEQGGVDRAHPGGDPVL